MCSEAKTAPARFHQTVWPQICKGSIRFRDTKEWCGGRLVEYGHLFQCLDFLYHLHVASSQIFVFPKLVPWFQNFQLPKVMSKIKLLNFLHPNPASAVCLSFFASLYRQSVRLVAFQNVYLKFYTFSTPSTLLEAIIISYSFF